MQTYAFGLRTAALEVRRAALRLPLDARGPRTASLRARTDAPFIPTDALCIRSAPFVSTDGSSTSSQRRRQRSKGSSLRRMGCPTHSSGRPVRSRARSDRTSGCCPLHAGMPCEGEEGILEESRGHRALLLVPALSRKQRCGHEERPLPRRATRRTKLGMPSMGFETPDGMSAALPRRGLH
jgi:hypothetical protein